MGLQSPSGLQERLSGPSTVAVLRTGWLATRTAANLFWFRRGPCDLCFALIARIFRVASIKRHDRHHREPSGRARWLCETDMFGTHRHDPVTFQSTVRSASVVKR